jgi:hypothetical protein
MKTISSKIGAIIHISIKFVIGLIDISSKTLLHQFWNELFFNILSKNAPKELKEALYHPKN